MKDRVNRMRVSDQHKVLFVHVQKTGGSTIDGILDEEVPDIRSVSGVYRHAPLRRILEAEPELEAYWSFGFVRNPWARMVSWWSMIEHFTANADAGKPWAVKGLNFDKWFRDAAEYKTFDAFVLEGLEKFWRLRKAQISYLTVGQRRADFIGRVESFDKDVNIVRERLGLEPIAEVPRRNATAHGHWRDYYNDTTRAAIARHYAPDLEAFGYTFSDPE
jgi:hypothetical protein